MQSLGTCFWFGRVLKKKANFLDFWAKFLEIIKTTQIHVLTKFGLNWMFFGPKWLFLADFDPILTYIKVKGFWDISVQSSINTPPYVYGHNFWTNAPNLKIQGILKTRDQWLSFYNKKKEIWKKLLNPPPYGLKSCQDLVLLYDRISNLPEKI